MPFFHLSSLPFQTKRQGVGVKSVTGTNAQLAVIRLDAAEKTWHSHPSEQIGLVMSGSADLTIAGVTRRLGPGDAYRIPGGVEHGFVVRSEEPLEYVEIFSPPKEENRTPHVDRSAF